MSYIPIIARVESLPPLPESVLKIEQLFAQGEPDIEDVVTIIKADPSLTADVLAKVNAPFYGFTKTIVSILQAITLFGSAQIRAIVLSSSMTRGFDINLSPYGISTSEFATISTMQSELAFQWYMSIDVDIARVATPIAFLMETGKILISKEILATEKEEEFLEDLSKYKVSTVENMYVMMTTAQINALVFEHLNLNESFYEVMKYLDNEQETPKNLIALVSILQVVRAAINTQEQLSEASMQKATQILQEYNYDLEPFLRVVKRLKIKYME